MRKKILVIVIAIITIAIVSIILCNVKNNKKFDYQVKKQETANYFILMQNNKYGVIDKSGTTIIDPIYDVVEMPNPAKDIFICKSNYNAETKEHNVQVFNKNKEPILYQYYIVEAISLNNVSDNGLFEKEVLKYKSSGLYGLIDMYGKKITEPIYESIEGFEYREGLLLTKKSGKYGIMNANGAIIIKNKYDEIYSDIDVKNKYNENYSDTHQNEFEEFKKSGFIVGKRTDERYEIWLYKQ